MFGIQAESVQRYQIQCSVATNNSNLREAVHLNLNKAFVKLNGKEKSLKIGANDYKHALQSRAHTDSAGGEAFCNEESAERSIRSKESQSKRTIHCD